MSTLSRGYPGASLEDQGAQPTILVNVEAEQRLVDAILIDDRHFHCVSGLIRADHFNNGLHARIFAQCRI